MAEALTAQFTVAWRKGELTPARAYAEEAATTSLRLGNRALAASVLREKHGGGWTLESFGIESAKTAPAGSLSAEGIEEAWHAGTLPDLEGAIEVARSIVEGWPRPGGHDRLTR